MSSSVPLVEPWRRWFYLLVIREKQDRPVPSVGLQGRLRSYRPMRRRGLPLGQPAPLAAAARSGAKSLLVPKGVLAGGDKIGP